MDALRAVKEMIPRMSNSELMAPIDNIVVLTERLRKRLLEENVAETTIQDCEQIMRSELSVLQDQLVILKQKHDFLRETLRQLEVWNLLSSFYFSMYVFPVKLFLYSFIFRLFQENPQIMVAPTLHSAKRFWNPRWRLTPRYHYINNLTNN